MTEQHPTPPAVVVIFDNPFAAIDARDARLSSLLETLSAASQEVAAQTTEATGSVDATHSRKRSSPATARICPGRE